MSPLDPSLLIGSPLIDEQHTHVVSLIEEFRGAIQAGSMTPPQLRAFLIEIHDYSVTHFRMEEQFMREVHYPAYLTHRREHLIFWEKMILMMESCEQGGYGVGCGERVYHEVATWLRDHIYGEDRLLATWSRVRRGGGKRHP